MTTPASSEATDFADRFTGYIQSVCADPGARAALRRGARKRPDDAPTMHRYLAAWTKPTDSAHRVAVLYAVASWIALYADTTSAQDRPDLGVALARATSRRQRNRHRHRNDGNTPDVTGPCHAHTGAVPAPSCDPADVAQYGQPAELRPLDPEPDGDPVRRAQGLPPVDERLLPHA